MKTDEEILEDLREQSKMPGSIANLMYSMIENAHPTLKENFEKQALNMMKIGLQLGEEIKEAENNPAKKEKWNSFLDSMTEKVSASPENKD